ncbi:MAG: tetratricopeptide repeat protein [Caulobacteraceae bacterium]
MFKSEVMAVKLLKLSEDNILVMPENEQIKKAILDKYNSIVEFSYDIKLKHSTVNKYLNSKSGGSIVFKKQLSNILGKNYDEIVLTDQQQIDRMVEHITENIKEYNLGSDLAVLEKLKNLCIKNRMTINMAKMYRNIGMYHFYRNNSSIAISTLQFAIDLLKKDNCTNLLIAYYSDISLIHFYNREYLYARMYNEEIEGQLPRAHSLEKRVLYLHYYRYGVLLSNMQEYELSKEKLEKSLEYAVTERDICLTTMNIGLLHKRQRDLKTALKYYSKALCLTGDDDLSSKGTIYNNIAEVYKMLGQYQKALDYINKAFECTSNNDLSRVFIYFNTYTEIKILMGESESVLDEFLKLLSKVEDFLLYKSLIIEGINNMIIIAIENKAILEKLENTIIGLIENNEGDNEEYIKELKVCLGNIRLCLSEL